MNGDVKYYGSSTAGALLGLALGLGVCVLIWPVPDMDMGAQLLAVAISVGGVVAGFSAGAWLGIRWEFGRKP